MTANLIPPSPLLPMGEGGASPLSSRERGFRGEVSFVYLLNQLNGEGFCPCGCCPGTPGVMADCIMA